MFLVSYLCGWMGRDAFGGVWFLGDILGVDSDILTADNSEKI